MLRELVFLAGGGQAFSSHSGDTEQAAVVAQGSLSKMSSLSALSMLRRPTVGSPAVGALHAKRFQGALTRVRGILTASIAVSLFMGLRRCRKYRHDLHLRTSPVDRKSAGQRHRAG